jgi:predicted dehydrogenase
MTYKTCIIGCGNIASIWSNLFSKWPVTHMAAYQKHSKTEVVGVCDIDINKAKECALKWNVKKFYSNMDEMLSQLKPDIVSVCTPCENHYDTVKKILQFPVKAILCEKPIADNLNKAKEMIKLCKEKNVPLIINHPRRYDELHNYVKNNLSHLVGNPKKISFFYSGEIINHGSHLFDLLKNYFGEIKWVQADSEGDGLNILLKFKSGLVGSVLSFDFDDISIFDLSIIGDKARIDLINKPFWDYDYRYFKKEKDLIMDKANIFSKNHSEDIDKKFDREFFVKAVDDTIRSIESGEKPISPGEEALAALEVMMAAIYSSQNEGKRINLPFEIDMILPKAKGELKKWQKD